MFRNSHPVAASGQHEYGLPGKARASSCQRGNSATQTVDEIKSEDSIESKNAELRVKVGYLVTALTSSH